MIFVTIQGCDNNGKHESAENGKIIKDDYQQEKINKLLIFLNTHNINANEEIFIKVGNYFFCTLIHPKKDIYNRQRLAMVWWDEHANNTEIKHTLESMGLSYESFFEKFKEFQKNKNKKKLVNASILILVLIVILIFLIK
ncbi:hypothetical protein MMU55_000489 [Campylobacter jejuni]|uniref:Lipoprotein n=1 Tax=Campylobacter jejuni TaxID=197 RepID=A0AB36G122_CAMJU|nr:MULTISPECIES: hypothetical protein [Campylobacter]ECL3536567.1 hypothetical protein [Campylobacter jejuni]ECP5911119.1 hypothetical protein [Campylobacter jejuni]ECP5952224.1 hypothetical protein [Campylobacter jejuni]ECP9362554.1 hypothetical protein [Campylobacter jejuni]EIY3537069.1 hypothetical protein [Campylobacter jejuni]